MALALSGFVHNAVLSDRITGMSLNLRQIEIFRAVMTTGSISGASQLLCVSQPAVSRLLSYTESRIGLSLFERIKGRLYATPEAKKLFHEVEQVYAGVQRVNALARELSDYREGILNLVSGPSVGQMLIPQAIAAFRIAHPSVKLTFQCLAQGALVDRLINHQADVGVTISAVDHPNLQSSLLGRGSLVCVCPEDHPLIRKPLLSVSDLAPYPLIAYDRMSPLGQLVQGLFEAAGALLRPVIEVGSPQNACALVQAGAGIALVDDFSVRSWPSGRLVTRPLRDAPTLQANLVHARFEPLSQIALGFIEVLRGQMSTYCLAEPDLVSP